MADIRVKQATEPLLTFHLKELLPDGSKQSMSLAGVDGVTFRVKETPAEDAETFSIAGVIVDDGSQPTDEYAVVAVQLLAAHTATFGEQYFALIVTRNTHPDVVKSGFFIVEDI